MKKFHTIIFVCLLGLVVGCAPRVQAPRLATGEPVTLFFLCDNGITAETEPELAQQLVEVSSFMQQHFVGYASKAGYRPIAIAQPEEYVPGVGHYMVNVKIKRYDAGSKALRVMVGFGAGAVSMDTHYELYAEPGNLLLAKDDGVGSSNPNWIVVPAKLNEKMLVEITNVIKTKS